MDVKHHVYILTSLASSSVILMHPHSSSSLPPSRSRAFRTDHTDYRPLPPPSASSPPPPHPLPVCCCVYVSSRGNPVSCPVQHQQWSLTNSLHTQGSDIYPGSEHRKTNKLGECFTTLLKWLPTTHRLYIYIILHHTTHKILNNLVTITQIESGNCIFLSALKKSAISPAKKVPN